MKLRGFHICSCIGVLLGTLLVPGRLPAQEPRGISQPRSIPTRSPATSPVETFRKLLAMTPDERNVFLTNYPASARQRILEKVEEYSILPEPLGELRLQVTELRWYLLPLLENPPEPAQREERLAGIPERYRSIIESRLDEWYILPPTLKTEVLQYETTMHYFVGRGAVVQAQPRVDEIPAARRTAAERTLARWEALPLAQRQQMYGTFQHLFELSESEKEKVLQTLTPPEREETVKVLEPIEKLPRAQQERYLAAFRQFAGMSAAERQTVMQNAQRWQRMSETERRAMTDLVKQVSDTPPFPIGFVPPIPSPTGVPLPVRTNPNSAPER